MMSGRLSTVAALGAVVIAMARQSCRGGVIYLQLWHNRTALFVGIVKSMMGTRGEGHGVVTRNILRKRPILLYSVLQYVTFVQIR